MPSNRIHYLDSIRGLAALAVVLFHLFTTIRFGFLQPIRDWLVIAPFHIFWDGAAAVSLFFVLSGMVLSYKYLALGQGQKNAIDLDVFKFYISRFCRLVIPFAGVLLISHLCYLYFYNGLNDIPMFTDVAKAHWDANSPISNSPLWKQAILIFPGTKHFLIPQGWSLTVEAFISLFMPFLIILAITQYSYLLILLVLVLALSGAGDGLFETKFLFHFVLGIGIAKYFYQIKEKVSELSFLSKLLLFLVAIYFYQARFISIDFLKIPVERKDMWYLTGIGSALLIMFVIGSRRSQVILNQKILLYLGKISYSLYLSHYIIINTVTPKLILLMQDYFRIQEQLHLVIFSLSLILIIMTAHICYYLVEKPSLILSTKIKKVRFSKFRTLNTELTETQ